jgi:hypothetical protein
MTAAITPEAATTPAAAVAEAEIENEKETRLEILADDAIRSLKWAVGFGIGLVLVVIIGVALIVSGHANPDNLSGWLLLVCCADFIGSIGCFFFTLWYVVKLLRDYVLCRLLVGELEEDERREEIAEIRAILCLATEEDTDAEATT